MFLAIGVGVHIYGLFSRFNDETVLSHIVHTISYALCLFAVLYSQKGNRLKYLYILGAVYPFYYHARCFFLQLSGTADVTIVVCLLVAVAMPLGILFFNKK